MQSVAQLVFCVIAVLSWTGSPLLGLCVQNDFANLRSGPGTSYKKTWKVFRYMPLKKLSKKNGWYKVKDVDGHIQWIREDLVTSAFRCAVIKNDYAHLRKGPGLSYPKIKAGEGKKYLSFRFIKKEKDWIKVEDQEGDDAWVHAPLVWIR